MAASTIIVDRAVLLERLREARAHVIEEHEKEVAAFPHALEKWNTTTARALHSLADRLANLNAESILSGDPKLKVVEGFSAGYHGDGLTVPIHMPPRPTKPATEHKDVCRIDRYIATVELVKAETFRLKTDDPILTVALPDRC